MMRVMVMCSAAVLAVLAASSLPAQETRPAKPESLPAAAFRDEAARQIADLEQHVRQLREQVSAMRKQRETEVSESCARKARARLDELGREAAQVWERVKERTPDFVRARWGDLKTAGKFLGAQAEKAWQWVKGEFPPDEQAELLTRVEREAAELERRLAELRQRFAK